MTRRDLPRYCYQKPRGVYFQRRGWDTVRFSADSGTPEFWREYALILRGSSPIPVNGKTFFALIAAYKKSQRWTKLAPRTQSDYTAVLTWAWEKLGPLQPAKMQRKDIIRARDTNAKTRRFANYIVQVLRVLFEFSIDLGWRDDNPANGVSLLQSDAPGRQPWPVEMIAAYRAAAPLGTRARIIFELGIGTGQRPGDLVKMRWDDLHNGGINVRQGKTGVKLWLPITRSLQEALNTTKRTGLTICAGKGGRPTPYRAAAEMVLRLRRKIGADAFDMHSWRYTAASELDAAGCDLEAIKSITGHRTDEMVKKYIGAGRQARLATIAMQQRDKEIKK